MVHHFSRFFFLAGAQDPVNARFHHSHHLVGQKPNQKRTKSAPLLQFRGRLPNTDYKVRRPWCIQPFDVRTHAVYYNNFFIKFY